MKRHIAAITKLQVDLDKRKSNQSTQAVKISDSAEARLIKEAGANLLLGSESVTFLPYFLEEMLLSRENLQRCLHGELWVLRILQSWG